MINPAGVDGNLVPETKPADGVLAGPRLAPRGSLMRRHPFEVGSKRIATLAEPLRLGRDRQDKKKNASMRTAIFRFRFTSISLLPLYCYLRAFQAERMQCADPATTLTSEPGESLREKTLRPLYSGANIQTGQTITFFSSFLQSKRSILNLMRERIIGLLCA